MECPRCRGLMVRDHFYDLLDGSGPRRITSLHELAACLLRERPGPDNPENRRARQACLVRA